MQVRPNVEKALLRLPSRNLSILEPITFILLLNARERRRRRRRRNTIIFHPGMEPASSQWGKANAFFALTWAIVEKFHSWLPVPKFSVPEKVDFVTSFYFLLHSIAHPSFSGKLYIRDTEFLKASFI